MRREDLADVAVDPLERFRAWLEDASASGIREPEAMALATADEGGRPAARMVLLKTFDRRGFAFATHYASRKGEELERQPWASLLFYWEPLGRQVRLEGRVERTSEEESDDMFRRRPRGAQLGAWASEQSREIPDRAHLERRMAALERRFPAEVPRPPHWGGYRLIPDRVEFWQAREHRLHDRLRYTRDPRGGWRGERLAP